MRGRVAPAACVAACVADGSSSTSPVTCEVLMDELLALMAVTTLSPADALTPEAVVAVVALVALPLKLAVMVPAEKLSEASRLTMVLAMLEDVAELAALTPLATLVAL